MARLSFVAIQYKATVPCRQSKTSFISMLGEPSEVRGQDALVELGASANPGLWQCKPIHKASMRVSYPVLEFLTNGVHNIGPPEPE